MSPAAADGPPTFDTGVAHPARVYDYWLGGQDNYPADREAAERAIEADPLIRPGVRANRAFLRRAVQYLAGEAGVRQFLDIGSGLPTSENTHQVAQRIAPGARVVYVDSDPIVAAHAQALLASAPEGATAYVQADIRDTEAIVRAAAGTLDFTQPVAVMALMVLQYLPDEDAPAQVAARLMAAVPPGSYLASSNTTTDISPAGVRGVAAGLNQRMGPVRLTPRSRADLARYFDGLDLVSPGLVHLPDWRAAAEPGFVISCLAGVARKPG
jgi:O-methyltransferase involved in polyketide biosynthesis